jgi:hypothetical protein
MHFGKLKKEVCAHILPTQAVPPQTCYEFVEATDFDLDQGQYFPFAVAARSRQIRLAAATVPPPKTRTFDYPPAQWRTP